MNQEERTGAVSRVQRELTTIARRGTARVRREDEALSAVDRSLLAYIQNNPGCRAVEIATHFGLNRSTVSRQLTALTGDGFVAAGTPAGSAGRGIALRLTGKGEDVLARAADLLNRELTRRLSQWTQDDVEVFARLLERYNEGGAEG